jgi:hypothetical protein
VTPRSAFLISVVAAAMALPVSAQIKLRPKTSQYTVGPSVQPLIIIGEGWSQQFVIVNVDYYDGAPTVGTLSFFTADGNPWMLPLQGLGSVDHVAVNLSSGQMMMLQTQVSFGPQQLGWASFDLAQDTNQWGIYNAYTIFRNQQSGRPDLMTTAGFVEGLQDEWILPFDNTGGKYPGIGVVNTGSLSQSETYTLRVYDLSDSLLKTIVKTVQPFSLTWFSLIDENPDLVERRGQIKVTGGFLDSAVFTLQFTPNGAFTNVPITSTFGLN